MNCLETFQNLSHFWNKKTQILLVSCNKDHSYKCNEPEK